MRAASETPSIGDSEPERVEIRQWLQTGHVQPPPAKAAKLKTSPIPVIEISDSDSEPQRETALCPSLPPMQRSRQIDRDTPPKAKPLLLSQYAYEGVASSSSTTLKPPEAPKAQTSDPAPRSKGRPRKAILEFVPEFNDRDISLVLRCVCCSARWTARKTTTEKRRHMQSCAKKASYTLETVQTLLKKEIGAQLPPKPPNPLVEDQRITAPTLFEGLNQAEPKRRAKTKQNEITVVSLNSTRDEILGRAQRILQRSPPGDASPPGSPPRTQVFAPSRLGGASAGTRLFQNYSQDPSYSNSLNTPSRPSEDSTIKANKPKEEVLSASESSTTELSTPVRWKKGRTPAPTLAGRKTPTNRARASALRSDWRTVFREAIQGDSNLSERILLYEPIPIAILITQLQESCSVVVTATIKTQMIAFLDSEGIVSFDPDTTWGRKKVKKRNRNSGP